MNQRPPESLTIAKQGNPIFMLKFQNHARKLNYSTVQIDYGRRSNQFVSLFSLQKNEKKITILSDNLY